MEHCFPGPLQGRLGVCGQPYGVRGALVCGLSLSLPGRARRRLAVPRVHPVISGNVGVYTLSRFHFDRMIGSDRAKAEQQRPKLRRGRANDAQHVCACCLFRRRQAKYSGPVEDRMWRALHDLCILHLAGYPPRATKGLAGFWEKARRGRSAPAAANGSAPVLSDDNLSRAFPVRRTSKGPRRHWKQRRLSGTACPLGGIPAWRSSLPSRRSATRGSSS